MYLNQDTSSARVPDGSHPAVNGGPLGVVREKVTDEDEEGEEVVQDTQDPKGGVVEVYVGYVGHRTDHTHTHTR